jgi:hypothetical protein
MSNPTRVMVMRSGAYQPLPNHLSLPWRHSWGTLLPQVGCVPLWLCGIGLGRQCFLQFLPDSQVVYSYRADNSIDPKTHIPSNSYATKTPLYRSGREKAP